MQELINLFLFEIFCVIIFIIFIWSIKKNDESFYVWFIRLKKKYFQFFFNVREVFFLGYIWSTLLTLLVILIFMLVWFVEAYDFFSNEISNNRDSITRILIELELKKINGK